MRTFILSALAGVSLATEAETEQFKSAGHYNDIYARSAPSGGYDNSKFNQGIPGFGGHTSYSPKSNPAPAPKSSGSSYSIPGFGDQQFNSNFGSKSNGF